MKEIVMEEHKDTRLIMFPFNNPKDDAACERSTVTFLDGASLGGSATGQRLVERRQHLGCSEHQLAASSGLTLSRIRAIEEKPGRAKTSELAALCTALQLNISDLL